MSAYDLILQGGTLYDPCAGTMELCDLAIKDGKIAARGKNLNAADAETVMDVTGLIVSPGLIDMHCHVYPVFPYQMPDSLRTINAEEYMFRAGVTTAVDAGTTGWRNFGDFKENVIDATKVRVLAFIDMAAKGMHYPPSEQAVADINPEITAAVANTWSDVIVGVKSAHYWAKHEDADHPIWASIDGAIKAASMSGKIVMVDSIPIVPGTQLPRHPGPPAPRRCTHPCVCAAVPPDGRKRQDASPICWPNGSAAFTLMWATVPAASGSARRSAASTRASGRIPSPPTCTTRT